MTDEDITVTVKNNLETVPDSRRAADLFGRILRAIREQAAEEQREQQSGRGNAA
jgi:hypothetical protein